MEKIPVTDNHIHVDPLNGEGPVLIANKFHRAGGSFMIIPNKPTWTVREDCSFKESMELVIKICGRNKQKHRGYGLCCSGCSSCRTLTQIKIRYGY